MKRTFDFDPRRLTWAGLVLVLSNAEQWRCTPAEAAERLLDQLAARSVTLQPQPEGDDRKAALVA
jgi:hypothetical protein